MCDLDSYLESICLKEQYDSYLNESPGNNNQIVFSDDMFYDCDLKKFFEESEEPNPSYLVLCMKKFHSNNGKEYYLLPFSIGNKIYYSMLYSQKYLEEFAIENNLKLNFYSAKKKALSIASLSKIQLEVEKVIPEVIEPEIIENYDNDIPELSSLSKKDLIEMAKDLNIEGYSKLNKTELIKVLEG